jgi:hypothetical protein
MTDKLDEPQVEVLLLPIWPATKALGFRSKAAAYAAVKRGAIPPEALVEIGSLTRIKKRWIERTTSGEKI